MQKYYLGPCFVCNNPIYGVAGQRVRFHKECRKEGRKRFGRATHTQGLDVRGVPLEKKADVA